MFDAIAEDRGRQGVEFPAAVAVVLDVPLVARVFDLVARRKTRHAPRRGVARSDRNAVDFDSGDARCEIADNRSGRSIADMCMPLGSRSPTYRIVSGLSAASTISAMSCRAVADPCPCMTRNVIPYLSRIGASVPRTEPFSDQHSSQPG